METVRDGRRETITFRDGLFQEREVANVNWQFSGTTVRWQPDKQFFTHTTVEISKVKELFSTIVCLCPGLTINLENNGERITYYSEHGLDDLVDEAVKNKELMNNRFRLNFAAGKNKMDMVLTYTSNYSSTLVPYVNTGLTESGPHITQVKSILTREFNKFFKSNKWLKDKEENLSGDDIQEGMYIVFNITAPNVAYDAQVKARVTQVDMTPFTAAVTENLNMWFAANGKEVKVIFDKAVAARRAREAAKKARDAARAQKKQKEKIVKFDSKLADCYSPDRNTCELYVTEGDSRSGNLKTARDAAYQAVLPVRGKILNVRKATLDKIQKNAEIVTLIEALGLTVDTKTMKLTYEPEDLRYGKIIIESDADVDGRHIKNLFYTFIWTFCPQLIIDGYIYGGVPPLYKITENKDNYIYLKDDKALFEYRQSHANKKYVVSRLKG